MEFWSKLNTKTTRATLGFLFCVAVFIVYIISQQERFVLNVQGSDFIDQIRRGTKTGRPKSSVWQSSKRATEDNYKTFKASTAASSVSLTLLSPTTYQSAPNTPEKYQADDESYEQSDTGLKSRDAITGRNSFGHLWNFKGTSITLPNTNTSTMDALLHFSIVSKVQIESVKQMDETLLNKQVPDNYSVLQHARIQRIKNACANEDLFKNVMYKGRTAKVFYHSENYNFSFCKVPKSGSTFWTKVFGVLKYGLTYGDKVFTKSRVSVHGTMGQYSTSVTKVISDQSRTILVSRCPFSRLFSAFIDKSFLQLMVKINYSIRNIYKTDVINTACQTNVTFQEFLDWVISRGKNGITLDRHWAPVTSMCWPCKVNPFILVKQETFSRDVEFSLQQLNVKKTEYDYIMRALNDHRAELSLPGIISTLFARAQAPIIMKCTGFEEIAKRTWVSLQIQGYIDERIRFPVERFNQDQFSNSSYFTDIVLETINKFPLDSSQSKAQRQRYLYYAYKSINPDTIIGIQELYKQDFEVFGYSKVPPTEY